MATFTEHKAKLVGKIDGVLTVLFLAFSAGVVELLSWASTALPGIDSMDWGVYNWAKVPVIIFLGAFLKGIDRKKHEDTTEDTGLVNAAPIEKILG